MQGKICFGGGGCRCSIMISRPQTVKSQISMSLERFYFIWCLLMIKLTWQKSSGWTQITYYYWFFSVFISTEKPLMPIFLMLCLCETPDSWWWRLTSISAMDNTRWLSAESIPESKARGVFSANNHQSRGCIALDSVLVIFLCASNTLRTLMLK